MELSYAQSCPSCGAEIIVAENSRLVTCRYCGGSNYMQERAAQRLFLPLSSEFAAYGDDVLYVPYLRFKGAIYSVMSHELQHRLVDTTRLAVAEGGMPASLGLRPQAMRILPVTGETPGRFLTQTMASKDVFQTAIQVAGLFREDRKQKNYHRAFVGETVCRMYLPCLMQDQQLVDGVDGRILASVTDADHLWSRATRAKTQWEPRFLSAVCPGCGASLSGQPDSLVLHCRSCQSLWQEEEGSFRPVAYQAVPQSDSAAVSLPFWRLQIRFQGLDLQTYADYLRFINYPMVIRSDHHQRPLVWYLPAFKLNPKAYLQASAQMTVTQTSLTESNQSYPKRFHAVNLAVSEAIQAVKTLLAFQSANLDKFAPTLPQVRTQVVRQELIFLPFLSKVHDLVQEHSGVAIQEMAVHYGKSL